MVRSAIGTVFSALLLGGLLFGWWFAADQNFGVMFEQAKGLLFWIGHQIAPLFKMLFQNTGASA